MKTSTSIPYPKRLPAVGPMVVASLILFAILSAVAAWGGNAPLVSSATQDPGRIHVRSDRMVSESGSETVEFIGNVKATQGATTITSDRLKIFYRGDLEESSKAGQTEDSIRKIVASGNVIIRSENRVAVTDQAEYHADAGTIVLVGPDSKVTSGNNTVTGERITMYRDSNRVSVEKGAQKQVEAVFYSGSKGLDFKGGAEDTTAPADTQ